MKILSRIIGFLSDRFNKTAPGVLKLIYAAAVCVFITAVCTGETTAAWIVGAAILFTVILQLLNVLSGVASPNDLTAYDMKMIRMNFPFTLWSKVIEAVNLIHHGEDSEALSVLGEMSEYDLNGRQKGTLNFYRSICYNHMGYPTNAGRCAAEAADNLVCMPESMLMAARNFALAGNYAQSEEYYEKLLPISEEQSVFPFIYNEMGRVYLSTKQGDKAEMAFSKALEVGFAATSAQGGMALACLMQNRSDEACEWYRVALLSRIEDDDGYKEFAAQVCRALGLPDDYLDVHLREKYAGQPAKAAE
ncbi:MAG: hypothetical protein NC078_06105 [Ruminococcus sp.]|nr:hypothetical protein [Ruminococcus sp.]